MHSGTRTSVPISKKQGVQLLKTGVQLFIFRKVKLLTVSANVFMYDKLKIYQKIKLLIFSHLYF
jgi:hypothetical protein